MKFQNIKFLLILLWLCLVAGCAPYFQALETPATMGVVHIYRPKKSFGSGPGYAVRVNGYEIETLCNGRYFSYITKPGRIQFSARNEITSYVTLDVEPGQTYYIRGTSEPGVLIRRPHLKLVSAQTGENEIASCRTNGKDKNRNNLQPVQPDPSKGEASK